MHMLKNTVMQKGGFSDDESLFLMTLTSVLRGPK